MKRPFTKPCRFYRLQHSQRKGGVSFQVRHKETDLWIRAERNLEREALTCVLQCRHQLEEYIARHPEFLKSLAPIPEDPLAPPLVCRMIEASRRVDVGPMAGVAGAIAEAVALALKPHSSILVVENGGDCYLDPAEKATIGVFAGPHSPFTGRFGLCFEADRFPLGICTSSATVGHSLSFGRADAVTVVSKDAVLADCAATALGNRVKSTADLERVLEDAAKIPRVEGVLILMGDRMAMWGNIEIVPL